MINRRNMLSLVAATGVAPALAPELVGPNEASGQDDPAGFSIIDTNVSLFRWPFRRLPLDETSLLVAKLRSLGITSAWAGSFEGLLHRDIHAVNDRLVSECGKHPGLRPIGSVNPSLPGWEGDLKRCLDVHKMRAIRVHPNYHGYTLDDPRFESLLRQAGAARCAVQIAVSMEDVRTQNEAARVDDVDLSPLPGILERASLTRIQLLNGRLRGAVLDRLAKNSNVYFDTARVEGTDGIPILVRAARVGRVLFGSHAPFLIPEAALIRVHESGQLDVAAMRGVYGSNAAELISDLR